VQNVVQYRRAQDRRNSRHITGNRRADDRKNTGANDGADTQCCERNRAQRLAQRVLGTFRIAYELIDGFGSKDLPAQSTFSQRCIACRIQRPPQPAFKLRK
jgi:hypothetical protein